ncbi:TRAP transporter large permease subunit [Roseobacter sp. N2S]|uniref:TRAP transporter large permease subunit n=1 Tax=Roseobacter sp. N2S TaxID=2663844 RepID=UPI0028601F13|nr:TRAP transporter large permease subunit [Roseobacter sp. N2S]MDR6264049.1 TRAP transporter 4TM/12TM fusion protein [Roseobacter sp. N2S]
MRDTAQTSPAMSRPLRGLAYGLGLVFVLVGLVNAAPNFPGLNGALRTVTGIDWITFGKFHYATFYPLAFFWMMLIVALKHSVWRDWAARPALQRWLGLCLDIAFVLAAFTIAVTYLIEIESVCLIDQLTGERAELIASSLAREREFAELYGLPLPDTVENPQCLHTTQGFLVPIVGLSVMLFLGYNVKVWGLPLVLVSILIVAYTLGTVLVWYFHGPDDVNKYLITKLGGEPRLLSDGRPKLHDALVNNGSGLLGRFIHILMNTVFPYIVLGGLFAASAGGTSLIKLAFLWTRHLRGGPAHAAVISSALFGTITGGPVINVLSTGVLTIPMMLKRGFSRVFAGGVEAAASSGGAIMPPVMGVAAFVLAALTTVPYRQVIIAAIIPAVAYFFCLSLSVMFQSRKQGIHPIGPLSDDMRLTACDKRHLVQIFAPILLILFLLLTSKDAIGCGPLAGLLGVERIFTGGTCRAVDLPWLLQVVKNSVGDPGSAGWWAVMLMIALLFLDCDIRRAPRKVPDALAASGGLIASLYLMFLAISIIDICLNLTGLSKFAAQDIVAYLQTFDTGGSAGLFRFAALCVTMLLAILLGMGMPAAPAYFNVALLMGPLLAGLGLSVFTAHMFIFYFAVASAITPPVALAAFASASITGAGPMATSLSAIKSGIVIFIIPFIFAFYPELLLIEPALLNPDPSLGAARFITGYDGQFHPWHLIWLLVRVGMALYLLASALAGFDQNRIGYFEIAIRLALALGVLAANPMYYGLAISLAIVVMMIHRVNALRPA